MTAGKFCWTLDWLCTQLPNTERQCVITHSLEQYSSSQSFDTMARLVQPARMQFCADDIESLRLPDTGAIWLLLLIGWDWRFGWFCWDCCWGALWLIWCIYKRARGSRLATQWDLRVFSELTGWLMYWFCCCCCWVMFIIGFWACIMFWFIIDWSERRGKEFN